MGGDSQSGSACSPHILLFERLYPLGLSESAFCSGVRGVMHLASARQPLRPEAQSLSPAGAELGLHLLR